MKHFLKYIILILVAAINNSCAENNSITFEDVILENSNQQLQFALNKYIDDANLYNGIARELQTEEESTSYERIYPQISLIHSNEIQFISLLKYIEVLKEKITRGKGNHFVFDDSGENKIKKIKLENSGKINLQNLHQDLLKLRNKIEKCKTKSVKDLIASTPENSFENKKSFFYKPIHLNYFQNKKKFIKSLDKKLNVSRDEKETIKQFVIALLSIEPLYNNDYIADIKTEKEYLTALILVQIDLLNQLENFNSFTIFRTFGCYADYRFSETQIAVKVPLNIKANTEFNTTVFLSTFDKFQPTNVENLNYPIDKTFAGKHWINITPKDKSIRLKGSLLGLYEDKCFFDTLIHVKKL